MRTNKQYCPIRSIIFETEHLTTSKNQLYRCLRISMINSHPQEHYNILINECFVGAKKKKKIENT